MSDKVRRGVIGCGGIASRRTLPEFVRMVSNAEVASVVEVEKVWARGPDKILVVVGIEDYHS